jgi:hypothetical protein
MIDFGCLVGIILEVISLVINVLVSMVLYELLVPDIPLDDVHGLRSFLGSCTIR